MRDLGGVIIPPMRSWYDKLPKIAPVSLTEAFKTATEIVGDVNADARARRMAAYLTECALGNDHSVAVPSAYTAFFDVVSDMVGKRGGDVEGVLAALRERLFDLPGYTVEGAT